MRDVEIEEICVGDIVLLPAPNGEMGTYRVGRINLPKRMLMVRPNWRDAGYRPITIDFDYKIKLVKSFEWDN